MKFAIDRLLTERELRRPLVGQRIALLAHPASVTWDLTHSLDALYRLTDIDLTTVFGPQHGIKGDKQDNMVETDDAIEPDYNIPVYSLYGKTRRPTAQMMQGFDTLLIDLQDIGCRVYTYITTVVYLLEAAAHYNKAVWVLDRPNPIGRPIDGLCLRDDQTSFVGAGNIPMRHGLTLGELGHWFIDELKLDLDYKVIQLQGWNTDQAPGFGWPLTTRSWVNPSPNASNLFMARAYPGTVLLEGTTLSEGRGTTRPLELFGAPDINAKSILKQMDDLAPKWLEGCRLRECWFEPTFHKHQGQLCHGIQIHLDDPAYNHDQFKPWRVIALVLKTLRLLQPDYELWHDFPYEYETQRLAIDVINGSSLLREWVDDDQATIADMESMLMKDEQAWHEQRKDYLIY